MKYSGSWVLVTGASGGIGAAFATRFAQEGANLVLVARRREQLERLAHELADAHGVQTVPIAADLARPGAGRDLAREVEVRGLTLDVVVNNAGFGATSAFTASDPEVIATQIALNVGTVVELTSEFLPTMIQRGAGVILNVASMAAYQPAPFMAVYGVSKAFVLSFTEALTVENRGSGVTLMALSPGPTRTDFYDNSGTDGSSTRFQEPEEVVDTALRVLSRRRPPASVVCGRANRAQVVIGRLLPRRVLLSAVSTAYRAASDPVRT